MGTKNKNNNVNYVPTLEEYITSKIYAKRAAALDNSRNRTSVRVPMILNSQSEEDWNKTINELIEIEETALSAAMANKNYELAKFKQGELEYYLKEKDRGYQKLVPGYNCMYNAGDCYGFNIPGNQTFANKYKEKGFKRIDSSNMESGDIVQALDYDKIPVHAMIFDSKDKNGKPLYNYAKENSSGDFNKDYVKQGHYPMEFNPLVYRYVGTSADSTAWTNEYKQLYGSQMKCGGRRKAQLGLDIREGGIAQPIAPNTYYMIGRSHDDGGIAIGPNNKNGLEVEGGEVVKVGNKDIKVFSSVPLLRGVSPAQLVMGGANPNKVFKAQEDFKDRHRINDDGTTYENGGAKIYTPSKAIQKQLQETGKVTIGGAPTIGGLKTYKYLRGLANIRKYGDIGTNIFRAGKEVIKRGTQKLVDSGKISKEVAQVPRSIYAQFVGGYGQNLPKTVNLINNNIEEKKYGGGMIYTINGNVRNGLMSVRPKAEFGKEVKYPYVDGNRRYYINNGAKIYSDGQIVDEEHYGKYYVFRDKNRNFLRYSIDKNGNRELSPVFSKRVAKEAYEYSKNKRPQYYAEKRLPVAGSQSIAEKAGLARSGWSYADTPTLDYVPNINISVPTNYVKAIGDNAKTNTSSTPRGRESKSDKTPRGAATATNPMEARYASTIKPAKKIEAIAGDEKINQIIKSAQVVDGYRHKVGANRQYEDNSPDKYRYIRATGFKNEVNKVDKVDKTNETKTSHTGGGTQPKEGRWVGQYKTTTPSDWIGLGANVLGSIGSYFITKSAIDKLPKPVRPALYQAAKLKTKYNINPQLTEVGESEQTNRATVRRNTQSSKTSIAREQRLLNEARAAKNVLYGQKENVETQLINQDKLNRQQVASQNVAAYNDYLNRIYANKVTQNQAKVSNINNLISGLTGGVNSILGSIESRRMTNNTLRAIAAANPNVDARLIGGFDYYINPVSKKKYNKNQQYVGTING